jgi:hypothetical protein
MITTLLALLQAPQGHVLLLAAGLLGGHRLFERAVGPGQLGVGRGQALAHRAQAGAGGAAHEGAEEEGEGVEVAERLVGQPGQGHDDDGVEHADGHRVAQAGPHGDGHHVRVEDQPGGAVQAAGEGRAQGDGQGVHHVVDHAEEVGPRTLLQPELADQVEDDVAEGDAERGPRRDLGVVPHEGHGKQRQADRNPAGHGRDEVPLALRRAVVGRGRARLHGSLK